ncbi:MAG: DUF3016 domain-containing protein [Undibacterium sp.]|nr:DUF3016 domain-containing protein [Opitutaceae bacterium]
MKTVTRLIVVLLGLVAPLALSARDTAKAPVRTEVIFDHPEKFTDVKDGDFGTDKGRDAILEQIRDFLVERADKALPAGQKLMVTFTDIDLAGDFEPWRGPQFSDVRIVKSIYAPRLSFTYKVTDAAGKIVKEGKEDLRDLAFDMRLTMDRQDPLRYEKDILKDWIREVTRVAKS